MTVISLHKNILEVIKDLIFYQNQLNYYNYVFNKDIYRLICSKKVPTLPKRKLIYPSLNQREVRKGAIHILKY